MPTRSIDRFARALVLLSGLLVAVPSTLAGQQRRAPEVPVTGRAVELRPFVGPALTGELIAVEGGRALLETADGPRELLLTDVERARVQRHGLTSSRTWLWVGIGAAVSGLGLTAACASVEDAACVGVLPVTALSWALVGGLLAYGVAGSAWEEVAAAEERMRPFARFPQGAPEGYRPR